MDGENLESAKAELRTQGIVYVTLALLLVLALTIGVAALPLGRWNLLLALGFSIVKTALIGWNYMELRRAAGPLWLFVGAGFFWLLLLVGLSLSDYLTRFRPL